MARVYKVEREGETTEYTGTTDLASALRTLGSDDYRRFGDDVKELQELQPGQTLQPVEGVKVSVEDDDAQGSASTQAEEPKPQDQKPVGVRTSEKPEAKAADTKLATGQSEPSGQPKK